MSPLTKRFPRELRSNLGKYAGIFIMMVMAIGLTSGFLMAGNSITVLIDGMEGEYRIEDGRFTTTFEPSDAALEAAVQAAADEATGEATLYPLFSYDLPLSTPESGLTSTARIYERRTEVDLAAYAEGAPPASAGEVALDRVFCENNGLQVGDEVTIDGAGYTLCGILTMPDYSALFEKNTDFVFDSVTFTVAEVTPEAFAAIEEGGRTPDYTYAFTFANAQATDSERTDAESAMSEALQDHDAMLSDLMDKSANQGIGYPAEDVEGDTVMWETLMMILIVIMAFMFVVLVSSTIEEESAIIGTLLASGWRKRELVVHYATLPCLVGVVAAVAGNVLGFIGLADTMKGLYYHSYSLPPYVAVWSWRVFSLTTVAPLALLIGITVVGLARKMRCTPLQFLRHETNPRRGHRGVALPERLSFPARFRLRVFLTNVGNFVTLFFGIMFASLLLLFGLAVLPTMDNYAEMSKQDVVAEHLYTLKAPLEIDGDASERAAWEAAEKLANAENVAEAADDAGSLVELFLQASTVDEDDTPVNYLENSPEAVSQAEKYAVASLDHDRGNDYGDETVTVYGVQPGSRYWEGLDVGDGRVFVSAGIAEKFGIEVGDVFQAADKYEDASYDFTVSGIYGSASSITMYMSLDDFNEAFDNDADYFNGYASDEELALNDLYLANDLTPAAMDKISTQMTTSMGDMMDMLLAVAVIIFVVFMYLLTKTVIDHSARSISYLKVFGYRDREINRLYIRSISITVAVSLVACLPLIVTSLTAIFKYMLMRFSGNIVIYVPAEAYVQCVLAGLASYAVVAFIHTRRIKKVPLEIALKVQE